ncbi:hypothetical protein [Pseudomonas sp. dw_358]|uniref:hypothetical protein n=1 Tax=Pseudomonas sp. dw_358 TaxID=2720083 RepID=UPI001BD6A10B|nr:hypothetical protein [Pseudomonas sp. dw_358]
MSKVGDLLDQLAEERQKRFPDAPIEIVVGRSATWVALMTEPGASQILGTSDEGQTFNGVRIVAAGGTDRDYDYRIRFENDPE